MVIYLFFQCMQYVLVYHLTLFVAGSRIRLSKLAMYLGNSKLGFRVQGINQKIGLRQVEEKFLNSIYYYYLSSKISCFLYIPKQVRRFLSCFQVLVSHTGMNRSFCVFCVAHRDGSMQIPEKYGNGLRWEILFSLILPYLMIY